MAGARRPMRVCVALVIIEAAAVFAGDGHASLADKCGVDLPAAIHGKLAKNAAKYPADRVRGSSAKYNEYKEYQAEQAD